MPEPEPEPEISIQERLSRVTQEGVYPIQELFNSELNLNDVAARELRSLPPFLLIVIDGRCQAPLSLDSFS